MSNVYATEPATSGRVIFDTTRGPIEIQLWCRECPQTTRIFLQLCLDGFFDNMIFHRIMPKFLIQTGALRHPPDIKSSSSSSLSMEQYRSLIQADRALERRQYEVHSRLRFNHRGQVAMALTVSNKEEDDEAEVQPQFFITLDESSNLDGKHVLFGKVDAPTIFNAIKIGETDVEESTHVPTGNLEHAPRVLSVKIVDNPIHTNLVPQPKVPWRSTDEKKESAKARKKKRKGKRDFNVLSFGDEVVEEMDVGLSGMKSSHDVLESKTLSKQVDTVVKEAVEAKSVDATLPLKDEAGMENTFTGIWSNEKTAARPGKSEGPRQQEGETDDINIYEEEEEAPNDLPGTVPSSDPAPQNGASEKVKVPEIAAAASKPKSSKQKLAVSAVEASRSKYTKGRKNKKQREEETMQKLLAFQGKVRETVAAKKVNQSKRDNENSLASRMARRAQEASQATGQEDQVPAYHGQVWESDEEGEGDKWLETRFKCRRHMDHQAKAETRDLGGDGRDMDDYEVFDAWGKTHDRSSHSGRPRKRHKDRKRDSHRAIGGEAKSFHE